MCIQVNQIDKQSMAEFLKARANGIPTEEFAEYILRNYSLNERFTLGSSCIEQAYTVIIRNLQSHDMLRSKKS